MTMPLGQAAAGGAVLSATCGPVRRPAAALDEPSAGANGRQG